MSKISLTSPLDQRENHETYSLEASAAGHLEFIARITSNIPDKGQVTVRYYGFSANAHRGKVKKTIHQALPLQMVEDELRPIRSKGWTGKIRKAASASIRLSGSPDGRRDRG